MKTLVHTILAGSLAGSLVSCAATHDGSHGDDEPHSSRIQQVSHPSPAEERGYTLYEGTWIRRTDIDAVQRGWMRADLDYLSPEEQVRHESGLFKCGPWWFDEADANDYHSRLLRWWKIPGERFVTFSTCSRGTTLEALGWMESTGRDLIRLYGREPELPCTVILLRSLVQYNAFAVTEPGPGRIPPESSGFAALHHAYLCEQWLDVDSGLEHPGAACGYWDASTEAGDLWGPYSVRHAAALAFAEGLDPSHEAIRAYRDDPSSTFDRDSFWREKRIPLWLRYGGASYCERFFSDPSLDTEDALRARNWSLAELDALGGLGNLREVFEFELDPADVGRSRFLILAAGALVAFMLDGENPAVVDAHASFRAALRADRDLGPSITALQEALLAEREAVHLFAGS